MSVLSFDGGGTAARLAIADGEGRAVHFSRGGGVNPLDNPNWRANLDDLFGTAHGALAEVEMAVVGMPAYGEVETTDHAIDNAVGMCLSSPRRIVNDVRLAHYAAFDGREGTLILAGTGSMAMTGGGEKPRRIGGWGDELGDEGSACWIGRRALNTATRMIDGRMPRTRFLDGLLDRVAVKESEGAGGLLTWYYGQRHRRSACASLAEYVDALAMMQDEIACSILDEAAQELCAHLAATRQAVSRVLPLPWSYAGGVFASLYIRHALERLMEVPPVEPDHAPIEGGLVWAARLAGWTVDRAWLERMHATIAKS